ncbi:hypothetical protein CL621_04345 [archaeon]|nr:hypothetical protein [archaeon]|tara:strand:- start:1622 stop:2578 length:957 start_codon:yes stop_codon:yes gene_type:complete
MKLITTIIGLEDIAINEVKELYKVKAKKVCQGRILFETSKKIKISRSCDKIYILLRKFKFKNFKNIIEKTKNIKFSSIKKDFRVKCNRFGNHRFNSIKIERKVGEVIFKKGFKVNLKSKEIIYVDIINQDCFIGILLKDNLCKRDYRIRINNQGLNACLSYSLLKILNWKKNESLLDPFCKDGTILIEAALTGGKKLYGMDSDFNIRSSEVNSKMAKVKINFYKESLDWLDTKFKKNEIDKIITNIPFPSKKRNEKEIKELYEEFFNQVKYILKDSMLIISPKIELFKKCIDGFKIIKKKEVNIGKLNYKILILKKTI